MKIPLIHRFSGLAPLLRARIIMGTLGILLVLTLIFGPQPWDARTSGRFKVEDYVAVWFWWTAFANLIIVSLLAATAGFWARPARVEEPTGGAKDLPFKYWVGVALASVCLLVCALPRMSHSLWHDEASRAKSTMVGYASEKEDGEIKFRRVKWMDALFNSRLPNHVLQSALSKFSHDTWRRVFRPPTPGFSEAALRIPSLLAGVAGIFFLAKLLVVAGSPAAGLVAAWLLALHPWYLRYSSEARGYAIVMALIPLLLIALIKILQTGRARWWLLYGACQFAMLYAYVTSLYVPLVVNIMAFGLILANSRLDRAKMLAHWLVTNILSAAFFIQLFGPNIPQLLRYLGTDKGQGLGNVMGWVWLQNFLSHVTVGIPWSFSFKNPSPFCELYPWANAHPTLFLLLAAIVSLIVATGFWEAWTLGLNACVATIGLVFPALLSFVETKIRGGYIYEWYLVYLLLGFVALLAFGLSSAWRRTQPGTFQTLAVAVILAGIAGYAAATQPQRSQLITMPLQPYREAVLAARNTLNYKEQGQEQILTAFFHAGTIWYDARLHRCRSVADIRALIEKADGEGKELFFTLGYLDTTRSEHPTKWRLLTESGLFEQTAYLRGFVPEMSLAVYRYRPGSATNFAFDEYPEDEPTGMKFYHDE